MSKQEIITALEEICSLLSLHYFKEAHEAVHELRKKIEESMQGRAVASSRGS